MYVQLLSTFWCCKMYLYIFETSLKTWKRLFFALHVFFTNNSTVEDDGSPDVRHILAWIVKLVLFGCSCGLTCRGLCLTIVTLLATNVTGNVTLLLCLFSAASFLSCEELRV